MEVPASQVLSEEFCQTITKVVEEQRFSHALVLVVDSQTQRVIQTCVLPEDEALGLACAHELFAGDFH